MKTINIRIEEQLLDMVTNNGENPINASIVDALNTSTTIIKMSTVELKGKFTNAEWMAMASATNGVIIEQVMMVNKDYSLAEFEDSETYDSTFTNIGADFKAFSEKINSLTFAQHFALIKRIKDYWESDKQPNLEAWASF